MGGTTHHTDSTVYADLHIHSIYSDGSLTPFEILTHCRKTDLKAMAITDHDTVSGIASLMECNHDGVEVIPAVEMSSNIGALDIHILGYCVDHENGQLLEYLDDFKKHRVRRVKKMLQNLSRDGVLVEFEQVKAVAQNGALGRPHVATVLVENGYVKSINEAFARYLGYHSPYYVPKKNVQPKEVINRIKECKGIPVVAHAGTLGNDQVIYQLIMDGLMGVEVWHPEHTHRWQQKLSEIALKNGLIMTGGSDCHGKRFGSIQIGRSGCGKKEFTMLKECWQSMCDR
ncbi:MAG: PHP domain-containing protein [candidate division WOR-3 bacterium]|nr:MAG: PHP domain-containing protein [candidate division WOR-3 bacterium]